MSIKRNYKINFDLHHHGTHKSRLVFDDVDIKTSDFSMYVFRGGEPIDIDDIKGTLYVLTPTSERMNVEVKNKGDYFYINLPSEFTKELGTYRAVLSLVKDNKRVTLNEFEYMVI